MMIITVEDIRKNREELKKLRDELNSYINSQDFMYNDDGLVNFMYMRLKEKMLESKDMFLRYCYISELEDDGSEVRK